MKRAYCTQSDWSRPSSLRMRAMSCGLACGPATMRAASDGSAWLTTNASVTVAHTTKTAHASRRPRRAIIAGLLIQGA